MSWVKHLTFFFILCLNHIHLIPLQLKTKPKRITDLSLTDKEESSFNPIQPLPCLQERTALNNQRRNTASLSSFPGDKSSLNGGECKSFSGTCRAPTLVRYIVKCCQGGAQQVWGSALNAVAHGAGWGAVGLSPPRVQVWVWHRQLSAERWHFLVWRWQRLSAGSRSTTRLTPCLFTDDIQAGMGVTGILIHLAVWKLPWNTVWWSLCRVHITRIIEEF